MYVCGFNTATLLTSFGQQGYVSRHESPSFKKDQISHCLWILIHYQEIYVNF